MKIRIGKIASWLGRVVAAALAQEAVDRLSKVQEKAARKDPPTPAE
ncbi:hypothetical protein M527_06960 [Sphingobium indicum IP26]|nr:MULTISPECIES: hypothetical protein [Sphingobium]EPR09860.1 hypothetical protein M527_06960 [Sphingobium indicum IP26]EQB04988.1 hypothetical protein L286_09475 [Sphingobium sp. HDIP04]